MDIFGPIKKGDYVYAYGYEREFRTVYNYPLSNGMHVVWSINPDGSRNTLSGYPASTVAKRVVKIIPFSENNMSKIAILLTRLVDKDVQTLIKADFLTENLDLTQDGIQALMVLVLEEKRADLVKLAKERLCD